MFLIHLIQLFCFICRITEIHAAKHFVNAMVLTSMLRSFILRSFTISFFGVSWLFCAHILFAQMPGMDMPKPTSEKHQPLEFKSGASKVISEKDLTDAEANQDTGKGEVNHAIIYTQNSVQIVIRTGPPEDMLSYRILGIRNPTLIFKPGISIRILFVNTDDDMHHDIRFAKNHLKSFDTLGTVGSKRLPPIENGKFSAEEITLIANDTGTFSYFCSVRGHAAGGMKGDILISTNPAAEAKNMSMDTLNPKPRDSMIMNHDGMKMQQGMKMGNMSGMEHKVYKTGSGTSWVPADNPMYMLMYEFPKSQLMIHGDIFPRYTYQSGPRGDKEFGAPNWIMMMYDHTFGDKDILELRGMFSLDAAIEGNKGYPLLLQTGEGLHDRQHPHDLFDELAVSYLYKFSDDFSLNLYGGLPGEPALGPSAFMHRSSAMSNPDAPLSHHWQDATHITFGVATLGFIYKNIKIEGSVFNGREPDSNRYDIDRPRFDSYSSRLSYNPSNELSLQASYGFLTNVEGDSINVNRLTISAIYTHTIGENEWLCSSVVFGQNKQSLGDLSSSILFESEYSINKNNIYGRAEYVQKDRQDLLINGQGTADVSAITLGYSKTLTTFSMIDFDLGAQATYNIIPQSLKSFYGNSAIGAQIYFSIHPALMNGMSMDH
jgi:hypothetical protein